MRRCAAVLLLVAVALAGCVSGPAESGDDPAPSNASNATNESVKYQTLNASEGQTLGKAHRHYMWENDTRVVLDAEIEAGDCFGGFFEVSRALGSVIREQQAEYGCAWTGADELTPPGTRKLSVEADASDALEAGGYTMTVYTSGDREIEANTTTEAEHTWDVPLEDADWDLPHQNYSGFIFYFEADGDAAVLNGTIELTITAHRIDGWEPPLAAAHLAHWKLKDEHEFVRSDAIEILGRTETVEACSWTGAIQDDCTYENEVNLSDLIPPGTEEVVLGVKIGNVSGCPPAHSCDIEINLEEGNWAWNDPVETGSNWKLYRYKVGEDIEPDSPYAETSQTVVAVEIEQCSEVDPPSWCLQSSPHWRPSVDVDFAMEAWRNPVDATDFKERRGLS